jgi:hypothetical protein
MRMVLTLILTIPCMADYPDPLNYLYPKPNSAFAHPGTPLVVRFRNQITNPIRFRIRSNDRSLTGFQHKADDGKTVLFEFDAPLPVNQDIHVDLTAAPDFSCSYTFQVREPAHGSLIKFNTDPVNPVSAQNPSQGHPLILTNGVAVPGDFPLMRVTVNDSPFDGKFFLSNWSDANPYLLILDNTGCPYFYKRITGLVCDFKLQENGILTAFHGRTPDFPAPAFIGYDSAYAATDTFFAAPGYEVDEHELRVLADGHYFLVALDHRHVDMSSVVQGGNRNAVVHFTHLQEFDSQGNLMLHFDSQENLDLADIVLEDPTKANVNFPHMNAIEFDEDGHILVSCRHLSAVLKINRQTGAIIWQLGGKKSDFAFVNDPLGQFECQHAVCRTGHNRLLIFDNGNLHFPPTTRAVEYELDIDAKTATMVWEYRQEPGTAYSYYMGNAQRLPNGNTLINWAVGQRPKATEVRPDGSKAFEMNFINQYHSYRTQKFDWNVPAAAPVLIAEQTGNQLILIFNQFGAETDHYRIYAGKNGQAVTFLDTSRLPMKAIPGLENHQTYDFKVASVNRAGEWSPYSNIETWTTNFVEVNQNLIRNGDFETGLNEWELVLDGGAQVDPRLESGALQMHIIQAGAEPWHIQLRQNLIPMIQGREYLFEFDAWATATMIIEARIENEVSPWSDFGRFGSSRIIRNQTHFSYPFIVSDPSDFNARVVFNCSDRPGDLTLDNVSLILKDTTDATGNQDVIPESFRILDNYPNPFNEATTLRFQCPDYCRVYLTIYDCTGRTVQSGFQGFYSPGEREIHLTAGDLSSGLYVCRIKAVSDLNVRTGRHKIMLIR